MCACIALQICLIRIQLHMMPVKTSYYMHIICILLAYYLPIVCIHHTSLKMPLDTSGYDLVCPSNRDTRPTEMLPSQVVLEMLLVTLVLEILHLRFPESKNLLQSTPACEWPVTGTKPLLVPSHGQARVGALTLHKHMAQVWIGQIYVITNKQINK